MPTFILIAIIVTTGVGPNRPMPITVEFSGLAQCEAARNRMAASREIQVLYSACERK